jgi:hypothetical protein
VCESHGGDVVGILAVGEHLADTLRGADLAVIGTSQRSRALDTCGAVEKVVKIDSVDASEGSEYIRTREKAEILAPVDRCKDGIANVLNSNVLSVMGAFRYDYVSQAFFTGFKSGVFKAYR